ncbi:hypothetical protein GCM10022631_30250 [Deinococcus rubellus]|uniref:hypothetical protein n=1 Tax=Deinococcus rubellus TaxID=1889240 RepID=UPI0031E775D8
MQPTLSDRQQGLVRATVTAMVCPSPILLERKGGGYPKRFYRQLKAEYAATHEILGGIEWQAQFTPELLIRTVRNYEHAQQRLNQARRLPRTFLGARIRNLAQDNESVALEVLETIANIANRAPKLH